MYNFDFENLKTGFSSGFPYSNVRKLSDAIFHKNPDTSYQFTFVDFQIHLLFNIARITNNSIC